MLKLTEIVICWVYYTIPFGFSLIRLFLGISFQRLNYVVWLRITDEGSVPEIGIWSKLLTKSDLKWFIHVGRSLFSYTIFALRTEGENKTRVRFFLYTELDASVLEPCPNNSLLLWLWQIVSCYGNIVLNRTLYSILIYTETTFGIVTFIRSWFKTDKNKTNHPISSNSHQYTA